jgi:UDP-N-acetylglucosamine--N-acetylmuramyl-(pentapeptide) pyrophosphoryl-undecaprenol N-acetylglucosamine transferase
MPRALALLAPEDRPQVTHQAGSKQIEALKGAYEAAGVSGELLPFINDMAERYASADLVICRSGALTVAELAAVGVASVLVPFPHAVDDHQTGNARFLADAGAAVLLPQTELTPQRLAALLQEMNRERLLGMAEKARGRARPDATARVADVCAGLAA